MMSAEYRILSRALLLKSSSLQIAFSLDFFPNSTVDEYDSVASVLELTRSLPLVSPLAGLTKAARPQASQASGTVE
jgi:hypothetical protein